jgi:glyoxylase-like metal-dependent hydrolase (beta-lactamase superfamily II)
MRNTPVTDNLTQLTRLRFVNAYLVRDDDGFTLVDTTLSGAADDLIAAASDAGGEIVRIALTHGHTDHIGSLDALKQQLGDGVQVLIPELDARILAGEPVVEGKLPGGWPKVSTTPDVRLKPGDHVGSLEVVPSPGHTPGHVSFLDTRDRTLIAGDSFTTIGRVAVPAHLYWRFPLATTATFDKPQAAASAAAACDLEPSRLAVGHGRVVPDPVPAMREAVKRAQRALS